MTNLIDHLRANLRAAGIPATESDFVGIIEKGFLSRVADVERMIASLPSNKMSQMSQRRISVNMIALLLTLGWLLLVFSTLTPATDDFKQYWQTTRNLDQTGDPYTAATPTTPTGFYYPPLFAYLVQPFGQLDQRIGQRIWYGLNSVMLAILIWLCIRLSDSRIARSFWGIVVLGMCLAPPTRLNLQLGQISFLIAILLLGSFALTYQWPALSGLMLALALLIRIYPALLILPMVRWSRRIVGWTIASVLIITTLSLVRYGTEPYLSFLHLTANPQTTYPFAAEHNISIYGFLTRLLAPSRYTAAPLLNMPWMIAPLTILGSLITTGVCLWYSRPTTPSTAVFSLWLCSMMLVSTTNGYYTLVLLLFPLLVLLRVAETESNTRLQTMLIIATTLVCVPPGWTTIHPAIYQFAHTGSGLLILTPSLYGLMLYLFLMVRTLRR